MGFGKNVKLVSSTGARILLSEESHKLVVHINLCHYWC